MTGTADRRQRLYRRTRSEQGRAGWRGAGYDVELNRGVAPGGVGRTANGRSSMSWWGRNPQIRGALMRFVLYVATGLSAINTIILLLAYLWDSSMTLFGGLTGYRLRPDSIPFTLSLIVTALLGWCVFRMRRHQK